jgi:hypothetical protein
VGFEIGVADLAIGVMAIISFWRSLEFKTPVVIYITLFCLGVAVGQIFQRLRLMITQPTTSASWSSRPFPNDLTVDPTLESVS